MACAVFLAYGALSYWLLTRRDGLGALDSCYFISATLSTVGYGDLAPLTQRTRLAAVFLVPLGLVVIGSVLTFATAHSNVRATTHAAAPA